MVSRWHFALIRPLMWLLLFALPLQGFAAATMLNCGPGHERMAQHGIAQHGMAEHGMAQPGDEPAPLSAHAHHHPQAGEAMHDAASVQHLDKIAKFKCSACAACCIGAALPVSALSFAAALPAVVPAVSVFVSRAGFFTDGPDRPPRTFLA